MMTALVRALCIVGLVVLMATGLASAAAIERPLRSTTADMPLRFAIEIEASQTLSWSVDQQVPYNSCGFEGGENLFLAPQRGSGELTWTFAGRAVTSGRRLTAPAQGSIQGTYGTYPTQGAWESSNCAFDFPKVDEIDPTDECGPFSTKGWADVGIVGRNLEVEAGIFHGFSETLRCPFLPKGKDEEKLTPFNFAPTSLPLTPQELSSGKEIHRTKTTEITLTIPLERGVYRVKQVNQWRVTMIPADELRVEELGPSSIPVTTRVRLTAVLLPPGSTATSFTWQLKRSNQSQWTTLETTPTPVFPHSFEVAGHFLRRTIANGARLPGDTIPKRRVTPTYRMEVRFPTWAEIAQNQAVKSFTQELWRITLNLATEYGRQEVGFWIALDSCSGRYNHTKTIHGDITGPDDTASLPLGHRPPDIPNSRDPVRGCSTYMVASFHTHTPTTFRTVGRQVGPSPADEEHATEEQVPGGIFDYIESPKGSKSIPPKYAKESPYQYYLSGLRLRPTPTG